MPALRTIPIYQVDAFTDVPFRGNPAAVCLADPPLDDATMQKIAAEMNLSETAFVTPIGDAPFHETSYFSLRWFTPEVEVPLCGHATLATSAVLFYEIESSLDTLHFLTKSGELNARNENDFIVLDFPSESTARIDPPGAIIDALGIGHHGEVRYALNSKTLLVVLEEEKDLRELSPDFARLRSAPTDIKMEGVIVTAPGSGPFHFISRFFAPWLGINEDPVTGAAHTILTPYWSGKLKKKRMKAFQASARGGEMEVNFRDDARVELKGNAVTVIRGKLFI